MKAWPYLREVCETYTSTETSSARLLALLDVVDGALAWRDSACETESAETDDYTVASMQGECAGDTHAEACPVAGAKRGVLVALTRLEAIP